MAFCLNDGTTLVFASNDSPTQQMSFGGNPVRVNIPTTSEPTLQVPNIPAVTTTQPHKGRGLLTALLVIGVIGVLFAVVITLIYFAGRDTRTPANASPSPSATSVSEKNTSTVSNSNNTTNTDDETAKLKEKLDKLEKQLAEQQKATNKTVKTNPVIQQQNIRTATVNSPNDGYLALRTSPSSSEGTQILKIPHGDTVTVGNCMNVKKADGKTGRWCQVIYNGQAGWAFDGFLRY